MSLWYFSFSLLFHILLLISFMFVKPQLIKKKSSQIEVNIVETGTSSKNKIVLEKHSSQFMKSPKPIDLYGKLDIIKKNFLDDNLEGIPIKKLAPDNSWRHSFAYSSDILTDFEGLNSLRVRFIKSLWDEVDKSIIESPYLSEYGHVGVVFLQFEVTSSGELLEKTLQAQADDNILKVIAVRAVRKALKNEFNENIKPTENILINARFSWTDYQSCQNQKGIHKYYLSFCKYGEDKRKTFSAVEKGKTYLGALRYGFGAIEEIQKYSKEENHRKTHFDPFEELRRDSDYLLSQPLEFSDINPN